VVGGWVPTNYLLTPTFVFGLSWAVTIDWYRNLNVWSDRQNYIQTERHTVTHRNALKNIYENIYQMHRLVSIFLCIAFNS
jgi:hypothetical protein